MDAVKKLNENFLSCSICTDRFKDPCTLGCGHTFCKSCLATYTKTRQDVIAAKSVLCPNCRQMTRAPDSSKPVEDWPKQMKPHFLIQGLLDEFAASDNGAIVGEGTADRLCFPCRQIGKSVQAGCSCDDCDVTLCDDCVRVHQSLQGTSHHAISDSQGEVKVKGRRTVVCKEHHSAMEFCCKKCKKVVCPKCGIIYHGKCNSLVTIDSMVADMKSIVKQTKQGVTREEEKLQTNLALQNSLIDVIDQNKEAIQTEIRRTSQQVMDIVKQKEKKLMDELDGVVEKHTGQLRGQIKSGEIDLQMYQQYSEYIDQVLRSESQMDLYELYEMCQSGAVKCAVDAQTDMSARSSFGKLSLVDKLSVEIFQGNFELGRLKFSQGETDWTKTPSLFNTIETRTKGDSHSMDPSSDDVTVLDVDGVDTVVVTDTYNNCVKSFYTRDSQTRKSTLRLSHEPHRVAKLDQNLVVISCFSHKKFVMVKVTPDLFLHSTITTKNAYTCLATQSPTTIVAGCREPAKIDILNLEGEILKSVSTLKIIKDPWFLCITHNGHILVSDRGSRSVSCLTQDGDVVFTFRTEVGGGPRGITTNTSGDIFVVYYIQKKVIQLTERGKFARDLLTSQDGLQTPYGICLYRENLYITERTKGTVKVFSFR